MSDLLSASGWECACACVSACVCALTLRSQVNFTLYGHSVWPLKCAFFALFSHGYLQTAIRNELWAFGWYFVCTMHRILYCCEMHKRIQFNSGIRISAIIIMHVGEELMRMVCRFSRMFHIGKICPKCGFNSFYSQLNSITSINWWRYFCFIFFDFFFLHGMFDRSIDKYLSATKFRTDFFFQKAISI